MISEHTFCSCFSVAHGRDDVVCPVFSQCQHVLSVTVLLLLSYSAFTVWWGLLHKQILAWLELLTDWLTLECEGSRHLAMSFIPLFADKFSCEKFLAYGAICFS